MRAVIPGLLLALVTPLLAVKEHDFKTCSQAAFCRRGRALSARASGASSSWTSPYSVDPNALVFNPSKSSFKAEVKSSLYPAIKFQLEVLVHHDGVARIKMDEVDGLRKRYDEASSWALITEPVLKEAGQVVWTGIGTTGLKASYDDVELVITYSPLKIVLVRAGREEVVLNGRGLLHMEHFRTKVEKVTIPDGEAPEGGEEGQKVIQKESKPTAWFEGEDEDEYWEETFLQWTDSKPKGMPSFRNFPS